MISRSKEKSLALHLITAVDKKVKVNKGVCTRVRVCVFMYVCVCVSVVFLLATHGVASAPATAGSLDSLLEMQITGPFPTPTKRKSAF